MQKALTKITIALFLLILNSCGYKLACNKTICIPFVFDDCYGNFTNEIIKVVSKSNCLSYSNYRADYTLKIKVVNLNHETVGFRKDQEKDFTIKNNIIASEGRLTATVCISILDNKTCKLCFGPKEVTSYVDYDYVDENSLQDLSFINQSNQRITVLDFSIGQLESEESARNAAKEPLFKELSKKIIDVISIQW
jgi:hypothetical protein